MRPIQQSLSEVQTAVKVSFGQRKAAFILTVMARNTNMLWNDFEEGLSCWENQKRQKMKE